VAKAREKVKIDIHQELDQSDDVRYNALLEILEDIFYRPHFAFESFINKHSLGGKDLLKLHITISLFAPIAKILHNLTKNIVQSLLYKSSFGISDLVSGALSVWLFFLGCILFIRFADIFRLYYKRWDRNINWDPSPPWVLMIGFLPFTASGIFFLLPVPLNLLMIAISFVYSLHLSYQALQNLSNFDNKDFLSFLLQVGIFLSFCTGILFGIYNIFRTIQS
jgi:hypothetical protein